jgi:hypothetical protein
MRNPIDLTAILRRTSGAAAGPAEGGELRASSTAAATVPATATAPLGGSAGAGAAEAASGSRDAIVSALRSLGADSSTINSIANALPSDGGAQGGAYGTVAWGVRPTGGGNPGCATLNVPYRCCCELLLIAVTATVLHAMGSAQSSSMWETGDAQVCGTIQEMMGQAPRTAAEEGGPE